MAKVKPHHNNCPEPICIHSLTKLFFVSYLTIFLIVSLLALTMEEPGISLLGDHFLVLLDQFMPRIEIPLLAVKALPIVPIQFLTLCSALVAQILFRITTLTKHGIQPMVLTGPVDRHRSILHVTSHHVILMRWVWRT